VNLGCSSRAAGDNDADLTDFLSDARRRFAVADRNSRPSVEHVSKHTPWHRTPPADSINTLIKRLQPLLYSASNITESHKIDIKTVVLLSYTTTTTLLLLDSFNGLFSRTIWVSRYQKSKTIIVKLI